MNSENMIICTEFVVCFHTYVCLLSLTTLVHTFIRYIHLYVQYIVPYLCMLSL